MTTSDAVIAAAGLLAAMSLACIGLIVWLLGRLRSRHAAIYESIGSPDLFWNNSTRSSVQFLKFLFSGSAWKCLDDRPLHVVVRLMQVFFLFFIMTFVAIMLVGFAGCFLP